MVRTDPQPEGWIPNIHVGEDYDRRYADASIHYDGLRNFSDFFGCEMPIHRHAQHLQLHFIDDGATHFHIDDKLYQVDGPSLFLTPAAVPHSFRHAPDATGHVLTVHQSLVWRLLINGLDKEPDMLFNQGACLTDSQINSQQRPQWTLIQQLLEQIKHEWLADHPAKTQVLEHFISILLIQVARISGDYSHSTDINNDDLRLFHLFSDAIEQHFRQQWLIPDYVDAIGVSETRLNQVCKRISNASPKKLVRERLLQEIKRLLSFTGLSSNEIAYKLGFTDPAYFSRFFKSQTGTTPLCYRREHSRR